MFVKKTFLVVSVFIFSIGFSQENNNLKEVVVKGRRKDLKEIQENKRHAQSTEILDKYDLNRNNPSFIEQSVNTMAGVAVDKRTQLGGQRFVIRGYGNDQKFNNWGVKAYYNNMPMTNADGVTIFDDFDFSLVDHIDVIKGPASTLYGSGIGGTVRFYSRPILEKGTSVEQKTIMGSFNLFQSHSTISHNTEKGSTIFNFTHLQSDGYSPNGSSLKNFFSYLGEYTISEKEKLNLFASYNNSFEQVTGQISYADYYAGIDNGNIAYSKKGASNKIKSIRTGITYSNKFTDNFVNKTTLFWYNSDFDRIAAGAFEVSKNSNYGLRSVFDLKNKLTDNWENSLSFGTEIMQSTSLISNYRFLGTNDSNPLLVSNISKGSYFDYENNQANFFFQNRIENTKYNWALITGLSSNKISYKRNDLLALPGLLTDYNKDLSFSKSFETVFTPHLALQKNYKNQVFNLSYSFGYNAPTASTAYIAAISQTNNDLVAEKATMLDFSIHGLLLDTKLDYQIAVFDIEVKNKLTQLSGVNPQGGASYNYWANTGNQSNRGIEFGIGYKHKFEKSTFLTSIQPFFNATFNDFQYKNFQTKLGSTFVDYSGKKVVGVPDTKFVFGLDLVIAKDFYVQNTFSKISSVYTDFNNTNNVAGYEQLNAKVGYKRVFLRKKLSVDCFLAGNNLTNQINYTFLFLGNNINDTDTGSNYPTGVATDVNPGPSKSYFFGGINLKMQL